MNAEQLKDIEYLLVSALPYVEEGEQFNKPTARTVSVKIRDMLKRIENGELKP